MNNSIVIKIGDLKFQASGDKEFVAHSYDKFIKEALSTIANAASMNKLSEEKGVKQLTSSNLQLRSATLDTARISHRREPTGKKSKKNSTNGHGGRPAVKSRYLDIDADQLNERALLFAADKKNSTNDRLLVLLCAVANANIGEWFTNADVVSIASSLGVPSVSTSSVKTLFKSKIHFKTRLVDGSSYNKEKSLTNIGREHANNIMAEYSNNLND